MNHFQRQAVESYFGPLSEYTINREEETILHTLMKGLHPNFKSTLQYLFKMHQETFKFTILYFSALPDIKQIDTIRSEIGRLRFESSLKKDLLNILQHIDSKPSAGRPKNLDTMIIESCGQLADFIWFYNVVPGKRSKASKEAVYKFIFDFIKACGYSFSLDDTRAMALIKDLLKTNLKKMDSQKF